MPTRVLADKIKSINLAWAFEIRSTLVTHNRTQLDFLSGILKATDCAQAKLNAKEWAKLWQKIETPNFVRIRPQSPTKFCVQSQVRDLADKIKSINLAWAFEIRSTLVTHYRTQLDFLSGSLNAWNLSATDCAQAKLKAKEGLNATLAENWNPKLCHNSTAESNKFLPHPNQPKPNTRTYTNEFLAGRSLLTLWMCSLFLQTSPAPMLTDRPRQPQGHQEPTKPIPRLQNHPFKAPNISPQISPSAKNY